MKTNKLRESEKLHLGKFVPQRFGIDLISNRPTVREREEVEAEMKRREGIFTLAIYTAYDPIQKKWRSRLEAFEVEPRILTP